MESIKCYKKIDENRYREAYGLYYEDFVIGDIVEHRPGRTIIDSDNVWFTLLTMNSLQLHFDYEYASHTEWKKPLVVSTLTLAIMTGMSVHSTSQKAVANLGWDKIKIPHPLFIGDTLYAETEILNKRESKSRPNQGIVTVKTVGKNQDGKEVMSFERTFLVYKKGKEPDTSY
ncbi:MAG: Mesaconyl-CoA hydratase [Chlamydiae bacterium]|nr:Mesaconyl-CoA hydratase [Chlamydiota bacterium]